MTAEEPVKFKISPGIVAKAVGMRLILGLFFVSSLMVLLVSLMMNSRINNYTAMITESTQSFLAAAALAASRCVSAAELDRYRTTEDTYDQEYREIKNRLIKFASEYNVLYVYYWREYSGGRLQYIVDNDSDPEKSEGPWGIYEITGASRDALAGKTGFTDLGNYAPSWDGLITGYAPVYDEDGNFYCVAGVDISDEFILIQRNNSRAMTRFQIIALAVSLIFGVISMLMYRNKAGKIDDAHTKLKYFNNDLRRAFSAYLPEDVVEEIVSDPTRLQLGGVKRHMTALFTDIKGFTAIAEELDPNKLVDILNYYLSTMSDVILEQKGTIDKYEGDGIISFFGAPLELPDHATRACVSAILMKKLERDVNRHILAEGSCKPLFTRIGINSGKMVVGNIGTQKKMNYTIISDAVNLASRIEGINKQYNTWILATENTQKETNDQILMRRLDMIRVVGINEPVRIYEVVGIASEASDELKERLSLFDRALTFFEEKNWKDARSTFNRVIELAPDDGPSLLYLRRCRQFLDFMPDPNWDGIFDFTEK